jgi:hypothetical protein
LFAQKNDLAQDVKLQARDKVEVKGSIVTFGGKPAEFGNYV